MSIAKTKISNISMTSLLEHTVAQPRWKISAKHIILNCSSIFEFLYNQNQTKLHLMLFLTYVQCHLVILKFHGLSQCQLALEVKRLNHLCKTLVKLLELINFKKFNLSLFLGIV